MNNEFRVIKGYISAAAETVQSILQVLCLSDELEADEGNITKPFDVLSKISTLASLAKVSLTFAYIYDLYYEEISKSDNKVLKWVMFGAIAAHVALIGILLCLIAMDNPEEKRKLENFLSGYFSPLLGLGTGVFGVIWAHQTPKTSSEKYALAYMDLSFAIFSLWKLSPIKKIVLKAAPFGPGIIALLLTTEGMVTMVCKPQYIKAIG